MFILSVVLLFLSSVWQTCAIIVPAAPTTPSPPTPAPPPPISCCSAQGKRVCYGSSRTCFCTDGTGNSEANRCDYNTCCSTYNVCCSNFFATSGLQKCDRGTLSCNCLEDNNIVILGTCGPSYTTCCSFFRRQRELHEFPIREDDDTYHELVDACGKYDYEVFLYVGDGHIYSYATPSEEAEKDDCPLLASHSNFGPDRVAEKELLVWSKAKDAVSKFPKGSLSIGTFTLLELTKAYETVLPSGPGEYDIVSNNCANFQLNLAQELGVKIDSSVTSYVSRRLLEDVGTSFVDMVKDSSWYSMLVSQGNRHLREGGDGADMISDEQLVELVVQTGVASLSH